MNKFLLFSGQNYYAGGGWSDYDGAYSTVVEALGSIRNCDWWQIVDVTTLQVVQRGTFDRRMGTVKCM